MDIIVIQVKKYKSDKIGSVDVQKDGSIDSRYLIYRCLSVNKLVVSC